MVRVIINKHLRQAVEETAVRLSDSKRDGPKQVFVRKSISRLGVSFLAIELTSELLSCGSGYSKMLVRSHAGRH